MNIAIVGAGTVGTVAAVRWRDARHTIVGVTGREATRERAARWLPDVPVSGIAEIVPRADVVAIAVPDGEIGTVAPEVATAIRRGGAVVHFSGALGLAVLDPVADAGGVPIALHPLQTFADVASGLDALGHSSIAVTSTDAGWELGERLASDLGGRPFRLADGDRALYHAAAVFASNYLVAVSSVAERLFAAANVPDALGAMRPLQETTLANIHRLGPGGALTGPAVRGDAHTVARNLDAIGAASPDLVAPYVVLCRTAMDAAGDRLDPARREQVEEVLARWS